MARSLRVLNVIGSLDLAGAEQYIVRVAPPLRRHGIDVEICVLERRGPLLEVARNDSIPVHGLESRTRGTLLSAGLDSVRQISSVIRRGRFDIVHSYLFHAEVVATPAARLAGTKRIIVSRRGMSPWRRPHGAFYLLLESMSNLLADELIANSNVVLVDVERTERFVPRLRTVIYNGVDALRYDVASPNAGGSLRLLTVGALAPRKGQEFAIRALRLVMDAGIDARLTLVGDGPSEETLRRVAIDEGVGDRTTFAGRHVDPRPFLLDADIFVLPSRQEGFSNALLEAMASGLPVVATDVGGNGEAIISGEGGAIVPPLNATAIAQAVIDLARERDRLVTMGRANRRRVEHVFSLEASVQKLATWYRRS